MLLAFAVALGYLLVPGFLVGLAARLRWLDALLLAGPLSLVSIGAAAILGARTGLGWSWWMPLAAGVVLAAAVHLVARWRWRPEVAPFGRSWPALLGLAGGLVGGSILYVHVIAGQWDSFAQAFDNTFHLNAIRWIVEHHDADPVFVGKMTTGDKPGFFYPAVWHEWGSLIVMVAGANVQQATHAMALLSTALVWPAGLVFLTRSMTRNSYAWVIAGTLAPCFAAFPTILFFWGLLYPNILGYSCVPAVLGLVLAVFRMSEPGLVGREQAVVLGLLGGGGMALAHPNSVVAVVGLALPMMLVRIWRLVRGLVRRAEGRTVRNGLELVLWLLVAAGIPVLWTVLRPANAVEQKFVLDEWWDGIRRALSMAPTEVTFARPAYPTSWAVMGIVVLSALILLVRKKHRWIVGSFGVAALLYLAVTVFTWQYRNPLTGPWYNDRFRLSALLPIAAIPMIALAFGWVARAVAELIRPIVPAGARLLHRVLGPALLVVGTFLLVVATAGNSTMAHAVDLARSNYGTNDGSTLLTSDKLDVVEHVPDYVPAEDMVMVNPWTGGALTYALTGRTVSSYHLLESRPEAVDYIDRNLNRAHEDPQVCEDVKRLHAYYVLDFGDAELLGSNHSDQFGGLHVLTDNDVAQVVYQKGQDRLLRVTACG